MSAVPVNRSSQPTAPVAIGDLAAGEEAAVAADIGRSTRRRRIWIWGARIATLVIVIGGWQLLTSAKIIDPFFWGQPSGIVKQLNAWVQHGTTYGSIWEQIWVTFKEAVLGFLLGVAAGVIAGVLLGMFTLPGRCRESLHQDRERDPADRAGLAVHRGAGPGNALEGGAGLGAGVLRGVLQRLPGRP